jgi:hypothetical protein
MWRLVVACVYFGMMVRALVLVPIGAVLCWIGGWIALHTGGSWLGLLIAGWFAYQGAKLLFGSLVGFVGAPGDSDPDPRVALRRAKMSWRR